MQEQAFLDELEQLGLLKIEDSVKWKMHRLDITQDFYVKCDPALIVKIIRYAGSVDPYRKGRALHYNQHNEIRSCKFEKTWYDFALYDKHQQLLNCEKENYPISPDDLERSKNLVRYEIQLKRPSLKEFEHDKLESSKLRFRDHALFRYFEEISDDIPLFLYRYAVDYFGKRIQKLRRERYLTQEELAVRLNVSDRHLRSLESGEYIPSIDLFIEIAAFFDVTLDHLIMGKSLSDQEESLRNKLQQKRLTNQKLRLKLQRIMQKLSAIAEEL